MRTLWLLTALVLLVATPGLAQGPDPYTLEVSTSQARATVSVDETTSLSYTVRFDSQNPFDAQDARDFQVALSGVPAGWTASATPSAFAMTAGATQAITVHVAVSAQAAADEATLTVTVRLLPRGADPVPVIGPVIDPEATAEASTVVTREDSTTRQVLEALDSWIWFILVAVLALAIIAAKLVSDARRIYVALRVDNAQVSVGPGKSVAVPIQVENLGQAEDTVVFHVMKASGGWSATLPVPELDLDGRAREELQLIISAPKSAKVGDQMTIGLSAHSARAPRRVAEAIVTATVE